MPEVEALDSLVLLRSDYERGWEAAMCSWTESQMNQVVPSDDRRRIAFLGGYNAARRQLSQGTESFEQWAKENVL